MLHTLKLPIARLFVLTVALLLVVSVVPIASAQTATCAQTYVVQKGDWLSTIAERFLGDSTAYQAIFDATNAAAKTDSSFAKLTDAASIEVGQKLCIPAMQPVAGRELAGIYTNVGPAADASALVETILLDSDGTARDTLDYVGKATTSSDGTWAQSTDAVTVTLTGQSPLTFSVKDGNLVGTNPPNSVYTKTAPDVAFYSALYTGERKSADGTETLHALTLLPNGTAQLNLSQGDQFITESGPWKLGVDADTGADIVTVNLTDSNGTAITDNYVFQIQGNLLRGTQYDNNKWGTDLTFAKFEAPSTPSTPANPGGASNGSGGAVGPIGKLISINGSYVAQLPAADAIGRVIVLDLQPNQTATLTTQFIGKGDPTVEEGTWSVDSGIISTTLQSQATGTETLAFQFDGGNLVLQNPEAAGYGSDGLTLKRVGSDRFQSADFGGVTFGFDMQLATGATGETLKAVPVSEGPALGGGTPAAIRFLFNGQKPDDFFNPNLAQVLVYKTDDWNKLDPSTAKRVADLKTVLQSKPVSFTDEIPVLPFLGATQVIRVQPQYVDFQNGSGIAFLTYYAQDVSPITADRVFYTFQGLTSDGKYYVSVFFPVTTALLPKDANTALGGQSYNDWAKNYQQYLTKLVSDMNGLIPAAYTPNLTLINNMVSSIQVADTTLQ